MKRFPEKYPNMDAVALTLHVAKALIRRWIKLAEAPPEIQKIIATVEKRGTPIPKGKVDYNTAYTIITEIKPEKQIELAEAIAKEGLPQVAAKRVIKKVLKRPRQNR